jgi:hypothetical protein
VQRWRCCSCSRSFTPRAGTLAAGLHAPRKLPLVIRDMFAAAPRSCRQLAAAIGLDKTTVWSWRSRINRMLAAETEAQWKPSASACGGMRIVRESRKASREWVDHRRDPARFPRPDRLRWIDYARWRRPLPQPMTPYLVGVRVGLDRAGRVMTSIVPVARSFDDRPSQLAPSGNLTADRLMARARSAGEDQGVGATCRPSLAIATETRERIDVLAQAFACFLWAFRGPATRHLGGYAAWFAARQNDALGNARGHAAMAPPR